MGDRYFSTDKSICLFRSFVFTNKHIARRRAAVASRQRMLEDAHQYWPVGKAIAK